MKALDYIYYRICDYYKKKRDSTAELSGVLILSLIEYLIFLDLFVIVRIFWEYPLPNQFNKLWALPILLFLWWYNWKKYQKPRKYLEFRKIWKIEDPEKRDVRGIGIVILIIVVFIIPILYGFIKHNVIEGRSFWG